MDHALIDQPAPPLTQSQTPGELSKFLSAAKANHRWIVMVCVLLGLSGAVRYWRELQFLSIGSQSKNSPFPLKDIPNLLGTWRALEGAETVLDPEIAKLAGSTDHVLRTYADDQSGERVTVLVLYGPADAVWGHTPDICYPASGFKTVIPSREVQIPLEGASRSVAFREALYGKSLGGATMLQEVYYSFRNAGQWRSEMGSQWKQFRYFPGMFKIQIERRVKTAQLGDSPAQSLLASLVEEIEKRSAPDSAASPAVVATTAAAGPAGK
ncbi:exosortase-associated EpsI family protein [Paludisphaera borealis]|nr:exosortase-associated EpsI family protein [Paludisphaera borealis]